MDRFESGALLQSGDDVAALIFLFEGYVTFYSSTLPCEMLSSFEEITGDSLELQEDMQFIFSSELLGTLPGDVSAAAVEAVATRLCNAGAYPGSTRVYVDGAGGET